MAKQVFRLDFCGRVITVETGEIAKQAGGSGPSCVTMIRSSCRQLPPAISQRKELTFSR